MSFVGNERKITVDRQDLLTKLKEGLEKHKAAFQLADQQYKQAVVEWFKEGLARVEAGDFSETQFRLEFGRPQNHADDFETAISMIEMSVQDQIVLDEKTFKQWVMGKWDWAGTFEMSASAIGGYLSSKGLNR